MTEPLSPTETEAKQTTLTTSPEKNSQSRFFIKTLSRKPVIICLGLAVLLAVLFVLLTIGVLDDRLRHFDARTEQVIGDLTFVGSQKLFDLFGFMSKPVIFGAFLILALAVLGWRRLGWAVALLGLAAGGGALLSALLKDTFQRVRPGVDLSEGIYSYPSGHAMYATCFFGSLIYIGWLTLPAGWWRALWSLLMAGLILGLGVSRVYFALHYTTDVIGGFLTGGIYVLLLISLHQLLGGAKPFLKKPEFIEPSPR